MAERHKLLTRRYFFGKSCAGLGVAALSGLLGDDLRAATDGVAEGLPGLPHFPQSFPQCAAITCIRIAWYSPSVTCRTRSAAVACGTVL